MKKILLSAFVVLIALGTSAQKTVYDANAQLRSVKGYHAIRVSGGIDLYLSYGDEAVAVSARDSESRDRIKTEVKNGVLTIWYDWKEGGNFLKGANRQLKAYVSYKALDQLSASGGSDIVVDGIIKVSKLKMEISGGSDFKGKVDITELKIDQSGGSDVDIAGRAEKIHVDVSGGSDFNGYALVAETAILDASGGSDIEITVNGQLTASASGGSDISYRGNAGTVNSSKSGGSSVRKAGK